MCLLFSVTRFCCFFCDNKDYVSYIFFTFLILNREYQRSQIVYLKKKTKDVCAIAYMHISISAKTIFRGWELTLFPPSKKDYPNISPIFSRIYPDSKNWYRIGDKHCFSDPSFICFIFLKSLLHVLVSFRGVSIGVVWNVIFHFIKKYNLKISTQLR